MTLRGRIALGLAAAIVLSFPACAEIAAYVLPAQCAAFWLGRDDFARISAFLDRNPNDLPLAQQFRAQAVLLNQGDAGPVDDFIARERPAMAQLIEATIWGDRQSSDLHDRLATRCGVVTAP